MKTVSKQLEKISKKYCAIKFNEDNYSVGGGLDGGKFASNRHEDANNDDGKLTEGKATQLFKKATGLDIDQVKSIINFAVPNMEWHHAGKLPKNYGGGMKKTYFLNSVEICDIATNWELYCEKLAISNKAEKITAENKKNVEQIKIDFLKLHAVKIERYSFSDFNKPVSEEPLPEWMIAKGIKKRVFVSINLFFTEKRECEGKYGWFDASKNIYNLQEYYTGWAFSSEEKYHEFLNIK